MFHHPFLPRGRGGWGKGRGLLYCYLPVDWEEPGEEKMFSIQELEPI